MALRITSMLMGSLIAKGIGAPLTGVPLPRAKKHREAYVLPRKSVFCVYRHFLGNKTVTNTAKPKTTFISPTFTQEDDTLRAHHADDVYTIRRRVRKFRSGDEVFFQISVRFNGGEADYIIGSAPTEEEAREQVADRINHNEEKKGLSRRTVALQHKMTPWGKPQSCEEYGEGVFFYSTASHGGYKVTKQKAIPEALRNETGWYEEDCEWARVALGFPDLFTAYEKKAAEQTLRTYEPNVWEAFYGRTLLPGESRARDDERFLEANKDRLLVISASSHDENLVKVYATLGGARSVGLKQHIFLVDRGEYERNRATAFVIDPERHQEITDAEDEVPRPSGM